MSKGAPKKNPADVKKNRCVRVSDNDLEKIFEHKLMTLQEFVDEKINNIKKGKK